MHYPFDDGALHTLGVLTHQKTIKSLCGKRVPFIQADAKAHIDCPHCRAQLKRRAVERQELVDLMDNSPDDLKGGASDQLREAVRRDREYIATVLAR